MERRFAASAIILAGGRSSRIGRDKSRLTLAGKALAQRAVDFLKNYFVELIYVTNQPQNIPWCDNLIVVEDEVPYQGPLGGILAGLQVSDSQANFVIGIDMPFFNLDIIHLLLDQGEQYDVVVPRLAGGYEPLYAVYAKKCLPVIRKHLKKGDFRTVSFYDDVKVYTVSEERLRQLDPDLKVFFNINTLADYQKAKEIKREIEADEADK